MEGLLSPFHIIIILVIVLILFGPGKLPDLGKGMGKGIREFKEALKGGMDSPATKKDKDEETKVEEEKKS